MFKPILLLSIVASLSACETISQANQCDSEKNFVYSNPILMAQYQKELNEGAIKSYYLEMQPASNCNRAFCIGYDYNYFDFYERNLNSKARNGNYLIKKIDNKKDSKCIEDDAFLINDKINGCYSVEKNDKILSTYKIYREHISKNKQVIISLTNSKTNEILYKVSYQTYAKGAVGGPGIGFCPSYSDNNPDFKFNPSTFPFTK